MKALWPYLLAAVVGFALCWMMQGKPPEFPTTRLDSVRTVTESVRVEVRQTDTLWRVRVDHVLDSVPVLIASVDSAQCRPVILGLTRCATELNSARLVATGWKLVALRDSAQVDAERARADSILDAYPRPPGLKLRASLGLDYDFAPDTLGGLFGVARASLDFGRYTVFGEYRLPVDGGGPDKRVGALVRVF